MDGNLPEPHRAVQNLWNAQLQPLNPVPLLFTLQLSGSGYFSTAQQLANISYW